ncbi:ribose import ATP-binding protein RbsA [Roseibium sp. TrichSKD4]|uniref:ATP-binding cassette domain-containing protein n=1 Tax=Roseibium sp. TrichSKD4 TaxID=744980 RepID=UPI0001E56DA0|nr:ATP-binding cassette domain-containing protein [Roseibium sp. TrichSKD4]EFO30254.1 ribose import ATP-binding protein RbsA [Roseibium sp. TrichSKD4]
MNGTTPVLSLKNIHKAFGGVVAIQDFSLDLKAGEIVALVGDNGAGKSTLIKIISGVHKPTSGEIRLDGEETAFSDASSARERGIEVVYQDLALAVEQPVYMNMFLGRELTKKPFGLLDKVSMRKECQELVDELDVRIPSASSTIRDLSGGQRQGIAIARSAHWASKLILLDEPTAALGVAETAKVEELVASLKKKNLAILIISDSLDQVFRLSDRICVLRRGQQIGVRKTSETDKNEIVSMITGVDS